MDDMTEEREDPYYPKPAQDPLWPEFEAFLFAHLKWQRRWNFSESRSTWWKYWLCFKAGANTKVTL